MPKVVFSLQMLGIGKSVREKTGTLLFHGWSTPPPELIWFASALKDVFNIHARCYQEDMLV